MLKTGKQVYKDMSRVELEMQYVAKKGDSLAKEQGIDNSVSLHAHLAELSTREIKREVEKGQKKATLYKTILPTIPALDAKKGVMGVVDELHSHTNQKIDINRNMLNNIYLRDPSKFSRSPEISKVMENNLSWPKGHIPVPNKLKKPVVKTKKELE